MNLQDLALQILVVTMMVSIGLDLEPRSLRELGTQRRAFGVGLLLNLLVFPGLTFVTAKLFELDAATRGIGISSAHDEVFAELT